MNKSELINVAAEHAGITKADVGRTLDAFITAVTEELKDGGQVALPGFGTFLVSHRAERTGRNPQTGELIKIKAARVAKFKAGKKLKEAVQTD